ncbi:hypothetical protein Tco_0505934 [Tanacetum coccineum]
MAKLLKENETLKMHYKELSDSIKIIRAKTIEHTTFLIAQNAEFKAQLQERGFAIAALKNELRKLTRNITTHYLPKGKESSYAKPHHMIAPGSSRYSSNDMVYNYYLEEAKKKTQESSRNSEPSVMPSAKSQSTANDSKPKPRINNQKSRNWSASKSSCVMTKTVPIAKHSRNSRNFSDSKYFVCSTCQKCVFNANHDSCVTKFLNEVNSHAKVPSNKTMNRNKPVKQTSFAKKLERQIPKGNRFSIKKTSVVHEKIMTPRFCLRWKSTGKIFKIVGLRWVSTGKIFNSSTTKVDSEPPNGSNEDITNQYEYEQTLNVSACTLNLSADTSFNPKKEGLRSKVVDFTTVQTLQVQVEELKSANESLNLSVEELSKARALVETTLRERDELIFAQCEKIRLLEEQCEPFYEVPSEFDSEIVHDTQDNSENDLILSLQTQLKETAELVVRFSDEKYYALKETESLKVKIKSLQTKNKVLKSGEFELLEKIDQMKSQVLELLEKLQISDQEMKQQIILFEEDKRMFLAKNEFLEKVSYSVQKEYNDLLAYNDVLKQRLETKFKFSKHDNSLEKMIEMIEKEYKSNVSKISTTSSTLETTNLKLVKEMGDKVKCFDDEKKVFENNTSKLEKVLAQRVKDFDDVKTELSRRTDKFETYFANLEKENALLKSQLASQNYTSLQKENNDLRTSYNVLKEKYENSYEKLEKENDDLKMHYKRLFDSIKQKNVVSQVFTKSIPKVNVSEKIYMDRKYWMKQHSSETFAFQTHEKNESSKQIWKRKEENISKRFKYSRSEMFSMRKRDDSVLKKVKDVSTKLEASFDGFVTCQLYIPDALRNEDVRFSASIFEKEEKSSLA